MSPLAWRSPGRRPMFWWRKRSASEPAREAIRLQCAQAWSEYAAVLYLGRQRVTYDVPGRRSGGTLRGRHRVRWFLGGVALLSGVGVVSVLLAPVLLPVVLVMELLSAIGVLDADAWAFGRPELAVTGEPDSYATALGDGVRATKAELWLAWSGSHIGVVAGGAATARLAWQLGDARSHDVRPASGAIDFSDGSSVTFAPTGTELDRLRDHNSWP